MISSQVCEARQRTTYFISSDYSKSAGVFFLQESLISFIRRSETRIFDEGGRRIFAVWRWFFGSIM